MEATSNFPELVSSVQKFTLFHLFIHGTQLILESCDQMGFTHFETTIHTKNIFNQLLIFENLYQHAINQVIPSIC